MKKIFIFVLISLTSIMTVINIYNAVANNIVINWMSLTSLAPVIIAMYSEFDWIYVTWNKLRSWAKNNTVAFSSSFFVYTDEQKSYAELQQRVSNAMKTCKFTFQQGVSREITSNYYRTGLKTCNGLNFDLSISIDPCEELNVINVKLDYQISSRTVKNSWSDFKKFRDEFINGLATQKKRYDIVIDMKETGLNPFYRLTLKPIKAKHLDDVCLKFNENGLNVEITKNRIAASAQDPDLIDKIIKQYIPLTSVY
ncbi:hypothetical protein [Lactiplantibacillus plantarum]|uniref:hypothetical protein n=1 Tax=Lactiplantibacillus plantarum TaxID=1590 RepID=UPI000978354B|nr:hypothetical protein [Lactiplantibacillus plantarum]MCG0611505.1 hypothetical protein [Lactiplantibacillus plantarum]MCG0617730.1 hypothetical protein [Lactiplantibacillus plantarum]MCG0779947.1 hypothetical protein [Lactiplantibacillus plantarum]MCG0806163.1 hypothetical protein [Lactiplantibacillus plantarum]MCG0831042.1 hypothetical protein [Lactiplantibacillus plantarum]